MRWNLPLPIPIASKACPKAQDSKLWIGGLVHITNPATENNDL
jgi:hypothetical protein